MKYAKMALAAIGLASLAIIIAGCPSTAQPAATPTPSPGSGGIMVTVPPSQAKLLIKEGQTYRLTYSLGPSLAYNTWTPWEENTADYQWFSFVAEPNVTYSVNWDDLYEGSGSYTGIMQVGVFLADKTTRVPGLSSDCYGGFSSAITLSVTSRQLIYLRAMPYNGLADYYGTFALRVYQAAAVNTGQSFSWYLDGSIIPGATDYLYVLDPATLSDGRHRVVAVASRDGATFSDSLLVVK